jgi:hypothetical protein
VQKIRAGEDPLAYPEDAAMSSCELRTWEMNRRLWRAAPWSIFLVSILLLSATAVGAEQAERPTPFVGYQLSYQGKIMGIDCGDWEITEIKPDGNVLAQCRNYLLESSGKGDFNPIRVTTLHGVKLIEFLPFAPTLRFPLTVGQTWQGKYIAFTADNGLVWDGQSDCKVNAYEPVRVIAGELQAFKIDCVDTWQVGPRNGLTHTTRWYAPEAAAVVKSVHQEDPNKWNFELSSFGLAGAAPTQGTALPSTAPDAGTLPPPPATEADLQQVAPVLDPDDY